MKWTTIACGVVLLLGISGWTLEASPSGALTPLLQDEEAPEDTGRGEDSEEDRELKRRSLDRKIPIAVLKLEQARMELAAHERSSQQAIVRARQELEIALAKMGQYRDLDAPNKIAQAKLSLQQATDQAQEASEELKQIEIMYEEQDLDDRTAEFVVNRGRRNAERRQKAIRIQEQALASLSDHEIPTETRRLQLESDRKKDSLEKAEDEAKAGALKSRIGIMSAEAELADLKEKLEKLASKEGSS